MCVGYNFQFYGGSTPLVSFVRRNNRMVLRSATAYSGVRPPAARRARHARRTPPTYYFPSSDLPPKTDLLHKGHSKGGKLLVVMVGLPGTGKTYISRKVARYLRWINYRTRAFSLAR